jgi:hypothetical protein
MQKFKWLLGHLNLFIILVVPTVLFAVGALWYTYTYEVSLKTTALIVALALSSIDVSFGVALILTAEKE